MANKGDIEHDVKYFRASSTAGAAASRIKKMCDEMQEDGWGLLSISWTHDRVAILVFARARRKAK